MCLRELCIFFSIHSVQPLDLLEVLAEKGCNQVLWECGPSLATAAIKQNCVQEIAVVMAPKLLGGVLGNSPLSDFGFTSIDEAIELEKASINKIGKDTVLHMLFPTA